MGLYLLDFLKAWKILTCILYMQEVRKQTSFKQDNLLLLKGKYNFQIWQCEKALLQIQDTLSLTKTHQNISNFF